MDISEVVDPPKGLALIQIERGGKDDAEHGGETDCHQVGARFLFLVLVEGCHELWREVDAHAQEKREEQQDLRHEDQAKLNRSSKGIHHRSTRVRASLPMRPSEIRDITAGPHRDKGCEDTNREQVVSISEHPPTHVVEAPEKSKRPREKEEVAHGGPRQIPGTRERSRKDNVALVAKAA